MNSEKTEKPEGEKDEPDRNLEVHITVRGRRVKVLIEGAVRGSLAIVLIGLAGYFVSQWATALVAALVELVNQQ